MPGEINDIKRAFVNAVNPQIWVEAFSDPAVVISGKGVGLFANKAADILLVDPVGVSSNDWKITTDVSLESIISSGFNECNAQCGDNRYIVRIKNLDDNGEFYLVSFQPVLEPAPAEIDPNKKLKKAVEIRTRLLKIAEEKYKKFYEESRMGIVQLDPNFDWISANPAFLDIVGVEKNTLPDDKFEDIVSFADRSEFLEAMSSWLRGEKKDFRSKLIRSDGAFRHAAIWAQTMDLGESSTGLQLCVMDITESEVARIAAESEKKQALESLESILRSMFEAMIVVDSNGRISQVNKAMIDLLGWMDEELIGKPVGVIIAGQGLDIAERTRDFMMMVRKSIGREVEAAWRAADGAIIPVGFTASIMRDTKGKLTGILGIGRDQRENRLRKQLEDTNKKLEAAFEELKSLDNAKDELVSMVGHELRTPLTSIRGFAELLCMPGISEEKRGSYANIVVSEIDRLARMLTDILDLEKIKAGKLHFNMEQSFIDKILADCADRAKFVAEKKNIRIKTAFETAQPLVFDVDRITQVVDNLLSNAIKFSFEKDEINLRLTDHKHFVKVAVQDYGVGVPVESKNAVFEKFEQTPEGRKRRSGTGLGMPIAKSIIENGHRGSMWFESEGKDKGATFYFTIPKISHPTKE